MNGPVPEQVCFMLSGWSKDSYVFKIKFDFSTCFSRNEVPFEGCALPWLVSIMPDCLHLIQLMHLAFHLCLLLMSPCLCEHPQLKGQGALKSDGFRASSLLSLWPPMSCCLGCGSFCSIGSFQHPLSFPVLSLHTSGFQKFPIAFH